MDTEAPLAGRKRAEKARKSRNQLPNSIPTLGAMEVAGILLAEEADGEAQAVAVVALAVATAVATAKATAVALADTVVAMASMAVVMADTGGIISCGAEWIHARRYQQGHV